jgi:PhnB protein
VTPYLCINGAARAIDFYKEAFDAVELFRMQQPDGKVGHAELQIGTSRIMLADEYPERGFRGAQSIGGTPVMLHLYVEDVDRCHARAVAAGGKSTRPVRDEFYGDRAGAIEDPFGHWWHIATHKEDLSEEEIHKRAAAEAMSGA